MTEKQALTLETLQRIAEDLLLRDGFLSPIIFFCNRDGACAMEIAPEYFENDDTKDSLVQQLVDRAEDCQAHKIFFVSECWLYETAQDTPAHEYREKYSKKEEGFQIVEIVRDSIQSFTRTFSRKEDEVTLGKETTSKDAELDRFKPLQEVLILLD